MDVLSILTVALFARQNRTQGRVYQCSDRSAKQKPHKFRGPSILKSNFSVFFSDIFPTLLFITIHP